MIYLLQVRSQSSSSPLSPFVYNDPLGSPPPAHMGGIPYSLDPSKGKKFIHNLKKLRDKETPCDTWSWKAHLLFLTGNHFLVNFCGYPGSEVDGVDRNQTLALRSPARCHDN